MTCRRCARRSATRPSFEILRTWYSDNKYGNVSTADFIDLAEQKSRLDLGDFFQAWLYEEGRPESW